MFTPQKLLLSVLFGCFLSLRAEAEVRLPHVISDHMVLQRSAATPLWGWAQPGEKVRISFDQLRVETTADDKGRWKTALDLRKVAAGPFEVTVEGGNRIVLQNVMVGEVWLAAGQSNMQFRLKRTTNGEREVAASKNPAIREFAVAMKALPEPQADCEGRWLEANPENSPLFSAVGYFFAKRLNQELGVPVGIIHASWGGTIGEAWVSAEALNANPDLKTGKDKNLADVAIFQKTRAAFADGLGGWLKATQREEVPISQYEALLKSPAPASTIAIPGVVLEKPGTVWLTKEIDLPETALKTPLVVNLQTIKGFETVYWNGQQISRITAANYPGLDYPRQLIVPIEALKVGKNTLSVAIFSPLTPPAMQGKPTRIVAGPSVIAGDWTRTVLQEFPALTPEQLAKAPRAPVYFQPESRAGFLFNAMINPIAPYGLAGIIWYQGESNIWRAAQYRDLLPLLIQDWRRHWADQEIPFIICQLPNFEPTLAMSPVDAWPELRESQSLATSLPKTYQAVLLDLGEAEDIHPLNKSDVGNRVAAIALAKNYGKDIVSSGPTFEKVIFDGDQARVQFGHADGGLVARPLSETYRPSSLSRNVKPLVRKSPQSELESFSLSGDDGRWHPANARIDGETVIVSSPEVPTPKAVRYAWANNPVVNLYNRAGLPAEPFRTDSQPLVTKDVKFPFAKVQ